VHLRCCAVGNFASPNGSFVSNRLSLRGFLNDRLQTRAACAHDSMSQVLTSPNDAAPLQRTQAIAGLKPSRTAQEFRWRFLKGQQMHATRLHEPVVDVDESLQWKEAGAIRRRLRHLPSPRWDSWRANNRHQYIEGSLQLHARDVAASSLVTIALSLVAR
jgi:hypothetical protein